MLDSLIISIVYIAFVAEAFIGSAVSNPFYVGRSEEAVDWETAKQKCELSGGQLATWSNKEQWEQLTSTIKGEEGLFYVGIDDLETETEWKFIDGDTRYCSPKSNTVKDCDDLEDEWAWGKPAIGADGQGRDCGAIYAPSGKLTDVQCSIGRRYICEYDADAMILGGADLSDINVHTNKIYIGFTHLATWEGAVEKCEHFGGQLATFGSEEEWSQLSSIIQENQKVYYNNNLAVFAKMWVGLTDIDNEGLWEFIDGDQSYCAPKSNTVQDCDDMEHWAPKEPNNVWGRGHCANIAAFWGGRLADRPCEEEKQYICEITDTSILITGTNNETPPSIPCTFEKKFIFMNERVDYQTAKSKCNSNFDDGQLATFGSEEEFEKIVAAIESGEDYFGNNLGVDEAFQTAAWIGLDSIESEGTFTFIDGDSTYCNQFGGCRNLPHFEYHENYHEDCTMVFGWKGITDVPCDGSDGNHGLVPYVCEVTECVSGTSNEVRRLRSEKSNLISRLMQ